MLAQDLKVFLAPGATDMRKSINSLSILVENQMDLDLFSGYLFGFCNRSCTIIKLLYWDRNGFCIWMKRLEKETYHWPDSDTTSLSISRKELDWLLEGLDISRQRPHKELHFTSVT